MFSAIACKNIYCSYGDVTSVKGVSFEVAEGEIFGLLGPNGAGKTSILSMLAGIRRPSKGSIVLKGFDIAAQREETKKILGYVPQSLAFYPTLTALDNFRFFCEMYQISGEAARKRIQEVLEVVGLADRVKDVVGTYSGGMKRRLNIAIGLLHQPKILLLDEPTAGVDPQSRNSIFECIEELSRTGTTIIYTTHYMEEIERLCKTVAILDEGQIIAMNTPQNLRASIGGTFFQISIEGENKRCLADILSQMESIAEISLKDSLLEITANDPQKIIPAILSAAEKLNIQIPALNISKPSLETVFLKLTGKGLRD